MNRGMNDSLLMLMSLKIVVSTHSPRNDAMATISKDQFKIPAMTRRIAVVVKTEAFRPWKLIICQVHVTFVIFTHNDCWVAKMWHVKFSEFLSNGVLRCVVQNVILRFSRSNGLNTLFLNPQLLVLPLR